MRSVFRLRVEEAIALLFLVPTSYLTIAANLYVRREGLLTARHPGGLVRLSLAAAFLLALVLALRFRPRSEAVLALREVVPFLACILIYTNLHDTIGFVNPRDVHHHLAALDQELFGLQPSVWAEKLITRGRTELMNFLYVNFVWIAPLPSILLLARKRYPEFRKATLAIVLCFYLGYFLYVVFPAAPPRLVLVYAYTKSLEGYPMAFSALSASAFQLLPVDSRAAFPSLHAAVSLLSLVFTFRERRLYGALLLPFVVGLWVSTIYLRHHYFVDLAAGWALAPCALVLAPKLDRWWSERQRALGYTPARGAP